MRANFIIDSREQCPYLLPNAIIKKLDLGDYSIEGLEHLCVIERKTKSDMFNTYSKGRARFLRELLGLRAMVPNCAVIIECTVAQFHAGPKYYVERKEAKRDYARRVYHVLVGWAAEFGVPFIWVDNRRYGNDWVLCTLKKWRAKLNEARRLS